MGLETVEIVLAVEEEFEIHIPDEDAARLESVGALHGYILEKTPSHDPLRDSEVAWAWLVALLHEDYGIPKVKITPSARFVADLDLG